MTIVGTARPIGLGTYKVLVDTVSGPSSYVAGGFTVTANGLTKVEKAVAIAGGGYIAEVTAIDGNTVTIKVYYFNYDAGADGAAIEVADGTDLSGVTFTVIAIGE